MPNFCSIKVLFFFFTSLVNVATLQSLKISAFNFQPYAFFNSHEKEFAPTSLLNSDLSTKFLIHLRRGLETPLKFELILGNSFSCFAAKLQDSSSQK